MPDDDYAAGVHDSADVVTGLATMGEKCGANACCVAALTAATKAVLTLADEEPTDPATVVTCQACGHAHPKPAP